MTELPSVWLSGQRDIATQLAVGGYGPATAQDDAAIPPAIAARAVGQYTRPGDVVFDPDCGAGTVLAEAMRVGRHAVGATTDPRWWPIARANVTRAKRAGAAVDGTVLDAGPHSPGTAQLDLFAGRVQLVVVNVRNLGIARRRRGAVLVSAAVSEAAVAARLTRLLRWCRPLLRPTGCLAITTAPYWCGGELLDLPGAVVRAGRIAGFRQAVSVLALTAELRTEQLIAHTPLAQRRAAAAQARATGRPVSLTAHRDVVIFAAPQASADAQMLQSPLSPMDFDRCAIPWDPINSGGARAA
ncbi:DNA methyltransferase [Streptodolium elevatio]|uniref:DNA methyltransferase n=1 Tax=Streptodolium elevatio TaxID=3157996 RepID=A0ABV3D8W4_9ACTN